MNRQVKQVLGLSVFAAGCMALGMGLSHGWKAAAQEERPVLVDAKGVDRLPPIAEVAEKEVLGQRHDAMAVDMESIAVAQVCRDAQVRFLPVRVISDPVHSALPKDIDYLIKRHTTAGRLGAAFGAIVRRPSSIKDLWQLKEDALVASERLAGFLTGIIAQLP